MISQKSIEYMQLTGLTFRDGENSSANGRIWVQPPLAHALSGVDLLVDAIERVVVKYDW
jgi:hypothetical protein